MPRSALVALLYSFEEQYQRSMYLKHMDALAMPSTSLMGALSRPQISERYVGAFNLYSAAQSISSASIVIGIRAKYKSDGGATPKLHALSEQISIPAKCLHPSFWVTNNSTFF